MLVNSKEAAAILSVNLRKLQRCVAKAENGCQKFLTIDTKYFSYSYTTGVGRGGKILQIWLDDTLIKQNKNDKTATTAGVNFNSTTDFNTAEARLSHATADFGGVAGLSTAKAHKIGFGDTASGTCEAGLNHANATAKAGFSTAHLSHVNAKARFSHATAGTCEAHFDKANSKSNATTGTCEAVANPLNATTKFNENANLNTLENTNFNDKEGFEGEIEEFRSETLPIRALKDSINKADRSNFTQNERGEVSMRALRSLENAQSEVSNQALQDLKNERSEALKQAKQDLKNKVFMQTLQNKTTKDKNAKNSSRANPSKGLNAFSKAHAGGFNALSNAGAGFSHANAGANAKGFNTKAEHTNTSGGFSDINAKREWTSDEAKEFYTNTGANNDTKRAKEEQNDAFRGAKRGGCEGGICRGNGGDGLCGRDNRARGLWLQEKGDTDENKNNRTRGASSFECGCKQCKDNVKEKQSLENTQSGKELNKGGRNERFHARFSSGDERFMGADCESKNLSLNKTQDDLLGGENLPLIATCSDKKRKGAFEKYEVIKEWEKAKGKVKDSAFIEHINSKNICSIKVTANKLYDWQRKYKNGGLDALIDERTNNKTLNLEKLGLKDYAIKLIHAQQGRINVTNIYNLLNYEAIKSGKMSLETFNGKRDEAVSYEVVNRFVKGYLSKNKLLKNIILYGEDGVVSRQMPAVGKSNWAVSSINQVVEIDASPLDLICSASDICEMIGFNAVNNVFKDKNEFENYVREWQRRYTIIALIDTYSGVATFSVTDTENSVGIARAVAKYILRYGKPAVIKGDNGKAFKSEYINSVMSALEIEYRAVRAYSGWLKPYVERNFRALQHNFTANLAGFIGHNITQRQAIEFFYSKKERRLKKGYKTNLKELKNLKQVQKLMDLYAEKFLNTRYLERLEMSAAEAYNEKANEAVAMDALSLSARLSKRELKHVNKKGVSIKGVYYQSPVLFNLDRVWVNKNIDNNHECFLWDDDNKFIGVAVVLDDSVGESVESAKMAQKIFNKRLKETKEAKTIATNEVRAGFIDFIENVSVKMADKPALKGANNESKMLEIATKTAKNLMKNEALSDEALKVAGSDVKKGKKHKSWEEFC